MTYTYNTTNTLASKKDAKGQTTVYTYDSNNRVTMVQRYPTGATPPNGEDLCQRVTYTYDTNPVNPNFSQYSTGRLTTVTYYGQNTSSNGQGCGQNTQYNAPYAYDTYTEMYSYLAAGAVTAKNLTLARAALSGYYFYNTSSASLEVDYTYDNAGRQATITYPMTFTDQYGGQPVMTTGYDAMGRPSTLTDARGDLGSTGSSAPTNWVPGVAYDYAGRLSSMSWLDGPANNYTNYNVLSESRTYNVNGQLGSMAWTGPFGSNYGQIQYVYSATQNNGQIAEEVDPDGSYGTYTTAYQYDALKRVTSAAGAYTGSLNYTPWLETFQYDGFGNLTAKVMNGTSTPIPVSAATNQLTNAYYDANGNMTSGAGATLTYDEANRVTTVTETSGGGVFYGYDASNKRIYQRSSTQSGEVVTLYGVKGENLGQFVVNSCLNGASYIMCFQAQKTNLWFAGRLVTNAPATGQSLVLQDRLGTNRGSGGYYPFGEGTAGQDTVQFATYTRDSYSGLDYADQRFYASTYGRFLTPDPYLASAKGANNPGDPGSWNHYAYTGGDPVNRADPSGQLWILCSDGAGDEDGPGVSSCDLGDGGQYCPLINNVQDPGCGFSYSSGPLTQGAGANSKIAITNLSTTSIAAVTVQNDLRWLQQAIAQDPTCDGWLQGSYNAINYMLDAPGSGATMMAVGVGNFPAGTNAVAGISGTTGLPPGMLITVALNGGFFNAGPSSSVGFGLPSWITGGSYAAQAEILLHELAHDVGATGFQDDGPVNGQPNVGAETSNNGLVMKNCGSVVALAAGMN